MNILLPSFHTHQILVFILLPLLYLFIKLNRPSSTSFFLLLSSLYPHQILVFIPLPLLYLFLELHRLSSTSFLYTLCFLYTLTKSSFPPPLPRRHNHILHTFPLASRTRSRSPPLTSGTVLRKPRLHLSFPSLPFQSLYKFALFQTPSFHILSLFTFSISTTHSFSLVPFSISALHS